MAQGALLQASRQTLFLRQSRPRRVQPPTNTVSTVLSSAKSIHKPPSPSPPTNISQKQKVQTKHCKLFGKMTNKCPLDLLPESAHIVADRLMFSIEFLSAAEFPSQAKTNQLGSRLLVSEFRRTGIKIGLTIVQFIRYIFNTQREQP